MARSSKAPAPLTSFAQGDDVQIEWVGLCETEAERLRELGVREGCTACVMMNTDKCILGVGSCRLALQREVAMQLLATPHVSKEADVQRPGDATSGGAE